jgi:adenosylcobinamide-GDP ribazoletransferase
MQSLALAVGFLTVVPVRGASGTAPPPAAFGRAAALFPLVGLALGALLLALDTAARQWWSPLVAAALALAALVALTGALHLDGFLDTCDGLFLWRPERRLEAMRDSRVGGFAVAGGLALYALKVSALASATGPARGAALLLAPVLGRFAMTLTLACYPYARQSGAGNAFKAAIRPGHVAAAAMVALAASAACGLAGLAAGLLAAAAAWLLGRYISGRLGGMTGDTYGFVCECVETLTLLVITSPLRSTVPAPELIWPR